MALAPLTDRNVHPTDPAQNGIEEKNGRGFEVPFGTTFNGWFVV